MNRPERALHLAVAVGVGYTGERSRRVRRDFEQLEEQQGCQQADADDEECSFHQRLRESIEHDESNVSRWHSTISNLRPGPKAYEIRSSLENRISDVEDKIRSKTSKLRDLEEAVRDMESKLR